MKTQKSYLQFRRGLRRYYQYETPAMKRLLLGPRTSTRWQLEYRHYIAGLTCMCSDACCAVMLS